MNVLVVAAMAAEMRAFRAAHRSASPGDHHVATGVLGIGTALARSSTERLVGEHAPGHVLVVGVAGGIGPSTTIGALVVPEAVLDGATGVEHPPAPIDGLANRGTLRTSDDLVVDPGQVATLVERGVIALDMETAAVAQVCEHRGIPWSVMRGISDHADVELIDPAILRLVGAEGEARPTAVARYVARHPNRLGHLARLGKGMRAATSTSADAAVLALRGLP